MIHIKKPSVKPKILIDNQLSWTNALLSAVSSYGGYSKIPNEEKNILLSHYRHEDIKSDLFKCSYYKCAFCETLPAESGNIEVEHFAPKSSYPNLAFEWDNFLPVCRKCNEAKSDHDTVLEPIINPAKQDPEEYFDYNFLNINPSSGTPDIEVSRRTIRVCNLNCTRLFRARSALLNSLSDYELQLADFIEQIKECETEVKKRNRIIKMISSLEAIESLAKPNEKYSAYCKSFLEKSSTYKEAKEIIRVFRNEGQV